MTVVTPTNGHIFLRVSSSEYIDSVSNVSLKPRLFRHFTLGTPRQARVDFGFCPTNYFAFDR